MTWQKIRMSSNGFIVTLWWTVKRFIAAFSLFSSPLICAHGVAEAANPVPQQPETQANNQNYSKGFPPMNIVTKTLAASLLALSVSSAFAAGSPGVEHNTQAFLDALAAGGGRPLEQLSPKDARA